MVRGRTVNALYTGNGYVGSSPTWGASRFILINNSISDMELIMKIGLDGKYHIVYKVTNTLNGKFYIGIHSTNKLHDGYFGSGKRIKAEIKKYGIENFDREILEYFDDRVSLLKREREIVNAEFLLNELSLNLKIGGEGGWDGVNGKKFHLYGKNGQRGFGGENLINGREQIERLKSSNRYDEYVKKMSNLAKDRFEEYGHPWDGRAMTEEHKRKIGEKAKVYQASERNSQFGTCWIYHELIGSRKCKKDLLPEFIEQGWIRGRG